MSATNEEIVPSFRSCTKEIVIESLKFVLRVLKMQESWMLFVSSAASEVLHNMALSVPIDADKSLATSILGKDEHTATKQLAQKLTNRFGGYFYVSYNIKTDLMMDPLLERKIFQHIETIA